MSAPAIITARREPVWRSRRKRWISLDESPFPSASGLPVRPRRRGIHRRSPRHRGADDRRERQGAAVGDAERSAGPDLPSRRDDPGRRVRTERACGLRHCQPADPATTGGDRAALAHRRGRSSGRGRGQARGDRGRSAGLGDRGQRSTLRAVARDLGIPLVFGQRRVAPQIAYPQSADRYRHNRRPRRCAGEPGAAIARGALSLGGDRSGGRRTVEPQVSCRLVGRGRAAGCPRQARGGSGQGELPAGGYRQAVHQGAVRRPG